MPKAYYFPKNNAFADDAAEVFLQLDAAPSHDAVDSIKHFMEQHARYITASQLRNVHARIRAGNSEDPERTVKRLPLLRVKLAYIKGKSDFRSKGFHALLDLLDEMIRKIEPTGTKAEKSRQLKGLAAFFEAVLAYHKFYENVRPNKR